MDLVKIPENAWVVVCDGRKALVLENIGDQERPNLRTKEVREHPAASTHEMGADRPGRAFSPVGSSRSAVGQTDWHDAAERAFLIDLVGRLDTAVNSGAVTALVIVAPPRALGVLRESYTAAVRAAVTSEVDKDLTAMPVDKIERHLVGKRPSR
jgi:protein required for attachment to host cells